MTNAADMMSELAALRADNEFLRQQIQQLLATIAELRAENDKQKTHIAYLCRMTYGRRSERLEGPTLFDEFPPPEPALDPPPADDESKSSQPDEPTITVKTHQRQGHGRKPLPADLPREREEVDFTDAEKLCPCCGKLRARIGADISERLDYRPACLFVREILRPKYGCSHCERQGESAQIVQPPLPPEPAPRSIASAGLLSHLLVSKYVDHLPLYRMESIFDRLGWKASRSTLCDLTLRCGLVLTPLYAWMARRVLHSSVLHTDDTSISLLEPRRTAHAWVYVGDADHPYTVFDLSVGRGGEHPQKFLRGFQGFLQADAFAGYDPIIDAGATRVGCWAHVRRKFFDARLTSPDRAHPAMAYIRTLYAVEAEAKRLELAGSELAAYRVEHAQPTLTKFAGWLAEEAPRVLPKAKIGEAFTYALNQWPTLTTYITDGRLKIDNHPAEQAIRPLAIGRRNWLHIGGDRGMDSAKVLLSLAASAKRHALNPWEYFQHILTTIPARPPDADLSDLLPDAWARARAGPSMTDR